MKKEIALLALFCVTVFAQQGSFTDARDSQTYKTVKIGSQTWLAENLNYNAEGSVCYENKPENCEKYGRLYDWNAAMRACPKGWHLPSKEELEILIKGLYISKKLCSFFINGIEGCWWSASEYDTGNRAYCWNVNCFVDYNLWYHPDKVNGYFVRCIKDN
jgi:hypothetical protein